MAEASGENAEGATAKRMNVMKPRPAPAAPSEIVYRYDSGRSPEASIIIPVWNGAHFLPYACESIRNQQFAEIEVVVVDDGSTDESCTLAGDLLARDRQQLARALVVRHARCAGPAAARDTGMRATAAAAVLLFDVDNIIYPRCVRRCLDALEASGAAFVYPMLRVIGSRGGLLGYQQFDSARLARGNYIDNLAMVRRSAWAAIGGFPNVPEGLEDYCFWLTLIEHGYAGAQIPEILGEYRAHPASRSEALAPQIDEINGRLEQAFPWIRLPTVSA
jgi:glycosyltransferase involved in cell wall biosynthesis